MSSAGFAPPHRLKRAQPREVEDLHAVLAGAIRDDERGILVRAALEHVHLAGRRDLLADQSQSPDAPTAPNRTFSPPVNAFRESPEKLAVIGRV